MSALKTCPQCGAEYELDVRFCPKDGTTLRVPAGENLVGSVVADRYLILKKLGEGGMGQVYLAEHVKMGRKSAIKVMNPSMSQDPDAIGRFNREASNASRISHNNVAAIYDFGETPDGLIYLAMEFVEGDPLTKLLEQGSLSAERASDIVRQTGEALDAAHDIGIVHRDLKPDNIMIAKGRDGSDVVKVVDFGIAKAQGGEGQKVTKTGLVVGTPEYMSPEQLAGDKLDGRSDTYALGLVAFHTLTGTLPFPSNTIQESMIMRLTDRPRTLTEMRPDVTWPAPLQAVMDRALARKPDERYQRSSDFGSDLVRAVRGMAAGGAGAAAGAGTAAAAASATGRAPAATTARAPDAVPPTRVPSAMDAGAGAPVPAKRTAGGMVPIAVGLGLVAAAVGGFMLFGQRHAAGPATAADSTGKPPVVAMRDSTAAPAGGGHADSARAPSGSSATAADTVTTSNAGSTGPSTAPQRSAPAERLAARRPQGDAGRVQRFSRPEPAADVPPAAGGGGAPAASGVQPAANPPASAPDANASPNDSFAGELDAVRARRAVNVAANLLARQNPEPRRAIEILGRAIKYLPTADDSVKALYHVSEALFLTAERTGNPVPKQRACATLRALQGARQSTMYESIQYLYKTQCQ